MDKSSNEYESDLMVRNKELEEMVRQMLKEKEDKELMEFPWVGNLGQWYWMVQSNEVEFNERKVTNLGYDIEELPEKVGFDFFTDKLHPDDYERVMNNMRSHLANKSDVYEVEYRILAKDGNYVWYYDRGKVTKRDVDGRPVLLAGIVFDISKSKKMESQLMEANARLEKMVVTDPLTGAFNMRFMTDKLEAEMKRYKRTGSCFSLVMMDIDHFKHVNDNFGHKAGDEVLKGLSKLIMERIRSTDIFCRWGGEEFILLLPDTEKADAVLFAENIRKEIAGTQMGEAGHVTASLGVTDCLAGETIDDIVKMVDNAMYKAKSEGRNCVRH